MVAILALALAATAPDDGDRVELRVALRVPADTPANASIYLAGDRPEVGGWRPDGLKLDRGEDGLHRAKVRLRRGGRLAFKFTRGSWATVEKAADGSEVANRTADLHGDAEVRAVVAGWATGAASPRASTVVGRLEIHPGFRSEALDNERSLRVWLPPGYGDEPDRRYPVVYVMDGQNVFDEATSAFGREWRADETATRLIGEGAIEPVIVVGVDNTPGRMAEFTPVADPKSGRGGKGPAFVGFLADQVKPFVDRTYRTRPEPADSTVVGSSLGGLIALESLRVRPDRFGKVAALSPSLWWADDAFLDRFDGPPAFPAKSLCWIDMGTTEDSTDDESARHVERTRRLAERIARAGGVRGETLHLEIIPGARHNEPAWAGRLGDVLRFLHPPKPEGRRDDPAGRSRAPDSRPPAFDR